MWHACAGLNSATDKTSKPSKSSKIQSLLHEIINDNSTKKQCISQGSSRKTKLSQKKVDLLAEMNVLHKPPREIVFPDEVLQISTSDIVAEVFQEKEQPGELAVKLTPRTKGDIIGFNVVDIQPNVNLLPGTVEGLGKRFHELYTELTLQR